MTETGFRCGGVVTEETTREELRGRGWSEEAIDEVFGYREYLVAKKAGDFTGDFEDWRRE